MKVLAGPRVCLDPGGAAARLCALLAGEDEDVVSLAALGLHNPYRRLSAAEVDALRGALRGQTGMIGYVCRGVAAATGGGRGAAGWEGLAPAGHAGRLVAVTDHVNLTWRSPLIGPNDDAAGPRFPAMDGIYVPDAALQRGADAGDMMVIRGVVAGVADDRALTADETEMVGRSGLVAVSSELVAPVIVAAHMGLRVAAAVLI